MGVGQDPDVFMGYDPRVDMDVQLGPSANTNVQADPLFTWDPCIQDVFTSWFPEIQAQYPIAPAPAPAPVPVASLDTGGYLFSSALMDNESALSPERSAAAIVSESTQSLETSAAVIVGQSLQRLEKSVTANQKKRNSVTPEAVRACIQDRGWSFTRANSTTPQDIPSQAKFMDVLARMYLTLDKMKDKFMPTKARLSEYQAQLETPDSTRHDAAWRHYTKTTFEYFSQPTEHPISGNVVHGLYKKLTPNQVKLFSQMKATGDLIYAGTPLQISMESDPRQAVAYRKTSPVHASVTSFEDSYNIIVDAHVKKIQLPGADPHHGRDATFSIVSGISSTITKEVVFQFVQICPGCTVRSAKTSKARALGLQTQRLREAAAGGTPKCKRKRDAAIREMTDEPIAIGIQQSQLILHDGTMPQLVEIMDDSESNFSSQLSRSTYPESSTSNGEANDGLLAMKTQEYQQVTDYDLPQLGCFQSDPIDFTDDFAWVDSWEP